MIKFTWLKKALFMVALVTAVAVVIAGVPVQTWAQVISGDLVGTVLDPSGASIAKATVTATHVTTGAKTTIATNDRGEYHFVNLPVGTYTVSASATGFNTSTVKNFEVQLNRTATANFNLKVGAQQTEIVVTGEAPPIDTTTAQIQTTYDTRALGDLPTSAGNILNLSLLQAGVASPGGVGAGSGPAVGGQRSRSNNFTVEGVDNNDKGVTGPQITIPNDSVENFTILQNQFSPEFGHSMGGQFNQTIKSGTNTFHGTVYEYLQNRNLNAVDYVYANQGILKNPRYDNNRWGFNVGGPVQKNKIFFFINYERNAIGQTSTPGSQKFAPTAAGYTTIAGLPGISANNFNVLKLYVAPAATATRNIIVAGTSIPIGPVSFLGPNIQNNGAWVAAGDVNISDKNQLRVRYAHTYSAALDITPNLPIFWTPLGPKNDLFTMSEYHTFSPNISNEVRIGFNRVIATFPAGNATFPGLDVFPNLQFLDLGNLQLGPDPNAPQGNIYNHYQAVEAIAIQHGRHSLKFGFEFHKAIAPETFVQRLRGDYDYKTLDLYLRDIAPDQLGERSVGISSFYGDQISTYWYANDNWRVTPRLSINLGIRHEYVTIPFTDRLQSLNAIASVPGFIEFKSPEAPKKNFAPRVGFSWDVFGNGKTSIRGGFGMAYDVLYDNIGLLATAPEFNTTCDVGNPNTTFCPHNGVPGVTGNYLKDGGMPPHNAPLTFATAAEARANTANFIPVNQKYPYSEEWNVGVQHTFGEKYSVEVRYLGSRGLHLNVQDRINRQPKCSATLACLPTYTAAPGQAALDALGLTLAQVQARSSFVPAYSAAGFGGANLVTFVPFGHSKYKSLAVQGQRRFSNGLQFQAAYTLSRTDDNSTADFFSTVLTPRRPQDFQCWGCDYSRSALDRTHRLSIAVVYDVPWMKHGNWFQRNLLGNWEIAPVWIFESPEYATVQSTQDANQNGDAAGDRFIINSGGNRNLSSSVTSLCSSGLAAAMGAGTVPAGAACGDTGFFDVAQTLPWSTRPFVVAYLANNPRAYYIQGGLGTYPNGPRNTLPLKRINNLDLTLLKRFNISERTKISFAAGMLNALNHPQFTPGSLNQITSIGQTDAINLVATGSPSFNISNGEFPSNARTITLALKFIF